MEMKDGISRARWKMRVKIVDVDPTAGERYKKFIGTEHEVLETFVEDGVKFYVLPIPTDFGTWTGWSEHEVEVVEEFEMNKPCDVTLDIEDVEWLISMINREIPKYWETPKAQNRLMDVLKQLEKSLW
jgi:hypothetical protein